ncbi:hypothetical protein D3C85_967310 [compost metagenome]
MAGEGREQGAQTGQGGAVAVNLVIGLLEHQVCRERRGVLCAELVGEIAVDDHHRLGVNVAGELSLALDVGHVAIPQMHSGGQSHRFTEVIGMTGHLDDGEAVDLAHLFTVGLQQDLAIDDPLIGLLHQVVEAVILLLQGEQYMLVGHLLRLKLPGQAVSHAHDGAELHLREGEPLLMVTETTGMATQGEEGTRSEVQQVPAQPQPGQVLQELGQVLFDVHLGHQIGAQEDALGHVPVQHLELGHIQPVAHQDQFEPDRRGLWGEEGGQGLAFLIGIPVQLAFLHGVLELEPEMGLIEQLVELQDEVAAVGFPQQARLQQVLIGIDGALLGLVVDGAKQSVPVQVPAIDDGGLLLFVMDQQVDEHRVLEFEPLGHVRRQIGEKVHDLGVIFLLADDAGDQAFGIQVMAHQLEQLANHLAEFEPGTGLQA